MKKLFALAVLAAGLASPAFAADPVEGVWKTQVDDGHYAYVTFTPCGASLCGMITKTFDEAGETQSENIGKNLVWDMKASGGGAYSKGQIWQPSTDKIFKSKMKLSGSTLKVSGCVAGGLICKKQTWSRVN